MTGIEGLSRIQDKASVDNIQQITRCFVSQVDPLKVILFGSFADGTYTDESDYDFYIVVNDGRNISDTSYLAYKSIRDVMRRPVDIVVGTNSRFEKKSKAKNSLMVEGEVFKKGILLYDQTADAVEESRRGVALWVLYDNADKLTQYGVMPRYPNEIEVDDYITEKAVEQSTAIIDWVNSIINASKKEEIL